MITPEAQPLTRAPTSYRAPVTSPRVSLKRPRAHARNADNAPRASGSYGARRQQQPFRQPRRDLITMGTIKSSESLAMAEYLRSQRRTTQAEADAVAAEHGAQARYAPADRHVGAAH
jgi:hypothetical protein